MTSGSGLRDGDYSYEMEVGLVPHRDPLQTRAFGLTIISGVANPVEGRPCVWPPV